MALNLLIVDDSSLTRKAIRRIIDMADLDVGEVLEAENGEKALKVLSKSHVDLVLSDLNMPEMCGPKLIEQMRKNEKTKSIPVIVVTTESQTMRIKQLLAEGVKDYLHKPFTPEAFTKIMRTLWAKPSDEPGDALTKALSQALETMAFLTILPMEDDLAIPEKTILTKISFKGSKNGSIQILADIEFGRILAENIGGLTITGEDVSYDALKELANVTCGLFLPMVISSTSDLFDITVPSVNNSNDSSKWISFIAEKNSCVLNIEGNLIATKLEIEDE